MEAKKKNRIKSYIYIAVFGIALVTAVIVTSTLINNIRTNRELVSVRDQLIAEIKDQETGGENEDCYTVYVKDDYTLTNEAGEVYIYKK